MCYYSSSIYTPSTLHFSSHTFPLLSTPKTHQHHSLSSTNTPGFPSIPHKNPIFASPTTFLKTRTNFKIPDMALVVCQEPPPIHQTHKNEWSFLNILENPSPNHVKSDQEVYVHPMVKRSASALSTKSLEMCTESLGTETGSDVSESSDEFSWEERERFGGLHRSKTRVFDRKTESHRGGGNGGFPPPITSISGSGGMVKVRPIREGGRLVIKAVSVSDCGTKFEAERTNGRLRLSLLKDHSVSVETRRAKMKNESGGEEKEACGGDVEEGGGGWWWKTEGAKRRAGGKPRTRTLNKSSALPNSFEDQTEFGLTRCKDSGNGNKGMGNWSLFRVVIS